MSLLYRKRTAKVQRSPSFLRMPWGMQPPAAEARPRTREGLRHLIDAIDRQLCDMLFTPYRNRAVHNNPPLESISITTDECPLVVIDDDSDDMHSAVSTANDKYFSEKAFRDRQYAAQVATDQHLKGIWPDEGVQARVDAMELSRAAEEGMMDIVQEGGDTAEEMIALRLNPLDREMADNAAGFLESSRSSKNAILIEKYNIPMSEYNLRCLAPGQWLNDEVVNFYMSMLQEKDDILCAETQSRTPNCFFNLYFMSKLLERNIYCYKNVKRWTKKIDIFSKDKIFVPVNINNTHWTHCVIYMSERRIQVLLCFMRVLSFNYHFCTSLQYYDSMGSSGTKYLDALMQYLQDEHKDKKETPMSGVEEWILQTCIREETPQQQNGYDCGVFSILFADFLSENLPLLFDQKCISSMRVKICASILAGKLWYCQHLFANKELS